MTRKQIEEIQDRLLEAAYKVLDEVQEVNKRLDKFKPPACLPLEDGFWQDVDGVVTPQDEFDA